MTLDDGAGGGNSAEVDSKKRLHIGSISRSERDSAIDDQRAFLFGSTVIDYTTAPTLSGAYPDLTNLANFEPILVIKNTSDKDLLVSNIFSSNSDSTGGTGPAYFTVWKNMDDSNTSPATDIFVQNNACPVTNMDIGSSQGFEGEAYIGDGSTTTFTGGVALHTTVIQPSITNVIDIDIPFKIPKGQNLFFTLVTPASNTSTQIMLAVTVTYIDSELPK